ncbi:FK506 binding protein proline rotamase rapamycin-binding protein [Coemansia spiralis]|uniref:peptidylprolyl isomerase n=2 Tax=Coemansia TaxID=4863 RepID=A0A9W8G676_9FUNG|nr:FK506 binding protein proline rotamase rapamycin-binding protein [Coemansia umbellata]KAJ2623807.1 FK506 binding protein proline rotamase rapamycin-binding protein [Coemansia sp. RSA 1358]KAJ2675272.1 FK506 binding protein proline rotamase rapamycin-binding protein [Coemansia spiralis]
MGVNIEVQQPGDQKNYPKRGDKITMHYVGTLEDGKKFDSSRDRGKPFVCNIGVGQLIRGWDEGVPQMSLGEKARLTITSDYGYGDRGVPGLIPPQATLIFDVELIKIN